MGKYQLIQRKYKQSYLLHYCPACGRSWEPVMKRRKSSRRDRRQSLTDKRSKRRTRTKDPRLKSNFSVKTLFLGFCLMWKPTWSTSQIQRWIHNTRHIGRVQLYIYSLILQHQTNRRQDKELENGNSPSPSPEQWLNKFYSSQENTLVIPSGNT